MKKINTVFILMIISLFFSCSEKKKDDYSKIIELLKLNQYDVAFTKLEKYKNSDEKYLYLGVYYAYKKDFKQADESYKKGLKINPKNIKICINSSVLLVTQERYQEAKRNLLECEKIDSKNPTVQFYLAVLDDIIGNDSDVLDRLSKIDTSELTGKEYEKLGVISEKHDKKTLAIKFYDYAIIKYREEKDFNSVTKLFEKVIKGKKRNSVQLQRD